jgi:hypothetical protein
LKRFSPAALLVMTAALILVVDAAIFVVPNALADPSATPSPAVSASADASQLADASPTRFFDDPSWFPATTENVYIPTPTPEPATPTPVPKAKPTAAPAYRDTVWNARTYVKSRVGAKGYDCINAVWTAESGWNPLAGNPTSGAYGIPQAFPGSKMAAFGSNWRYSPLTQVKWGLWYVTNKYKSACGAYDFWQAHGWY